MNYDFLKIVLIKNRYPKDTCTTEYCNIQVRSMMPLFFFFTKKKTTNYWHASSLPRDHL